MTVSRLRDLAPAEREGSTAAAAGINSRRAHVPREIPRLRERLAAARHIAREALWHINFVFSPAAKSFSSLSCATNIFPRQRAAG